MIGACNGFQVLVQVGLLPGPSGGHGWPDGRRASRSPTTSTPASSTAGRRAEPDSRCVWTRPLLDERFHDDSMMLPIAHGEGRFVADSPDTISSLERAGQVALRYTDADNINGSEARIAGICDPSGRIFGLMPHPERYTQWTHHPFWTRLAPDARRGDTPGLAMFRAAVEACREPVGA